MNKDKKLTINMLLIAIKSVVTALFPLITFPYITRVLGVENLGIYNFSASIIIYIQLIAGLGISTYAIREGAKLRDDINRLNTFACEMFTINIVFTVVAYIILASMLLEVRRFTEYKNLILVLSLAVLFTTLGVEWLFSIFEDFMFITIRTLLFQLLSIVLLFCFVKDSHDLINYAIITVISSSGAGLVNYFFSKKYLKIKPTLYMNIKKHIKPILILFGMTATVSIYVSSDTTLLGFLCDDSTVGIYSVSTKVYSLIKTVLSSVITVAIPRLSLHLGRGETKEYKGTLKNVYEILITIMLPIVVGLIIYRNQIVQIVAGKDFMAATISLAILSIAIIFCMGAWFWGQCVLVVQGKEKIVLRITVLSAIINIFLNIILIPIWRENAAAITTVVAEGFSFLCCRYYGTKLTGNFDFGSCIKKVIVGCVGYSASIFIVCLLIKNYIISTIVSLLLSAAVYLIIEILLQNSSVYELIDTFFNYKKR